MNDLLQRRAMYEAAGPAPALMITEGLLLYLPAPAVEALAAETSNQNGIRHWISDVTTSAFSRVLGGDRDTMQPIRHVQASDARQGEQILDTIQRHGWTTSSKRSYITDVEFVYELMCELGDPDKVEELITIPRTCTITMPGSCKGRACPAARVVQSCP